MNIRQKDEITYKGNSEKIKNEKSKRQAYFYDSGYILCKCDGYEVTGYKISGLDKEDYILQTENNGFILKSKVIMPFHMVRRSRSHIQ